MNARDHNEAAFRAKLEWHKEQAKISIEEKFRILLKMQRDDLPLIERLRPLKWYERPWEIDPG